MSTLRGRILIGLLLIVALMIIAVVVFNFHYLKKREQVLAVSKDIDRLHILFLRDTRIISDFFRTDMYKPDFFVNQSTDLIAQHNSFITSINGIESFSDYKSLTNKFCIAQGIDSLYLSLIEYNKKIEQIINFVNERGFKDYGIEGQMRSYIHKLEEFNEIDKSQILSLRRHEKDYIIRNEDVYIKKLNSLSQDIIDNLEVRRFSSKLRYDSALNLVRLYTESFNRMVEVDRTIGVKSNSGLKYELDTIIKKIDNQFSKVLISVAETERNYYKRLNLEYLIFFILLFSLAAIFSIYLSFKISKPLHSLVFHINQYVDSNFKFWSKVEIDKSSQEIDELIGSFNNMVEQLEKKELAKIRAEKKVIENEVKYRELAELLPVGIFETDKDGALLFVNKAWVNSVGFCKRDLKNKILFSQLISNADLDKLFTGRKTNYLECNVIRKDKTVFDAIVITNEIIHNNIKEGIRGIIIDNTERKKILDDLRAEKIKAQQSDKLKTAFLANMSHEIRTPMNAIIGFSSLLERGDCDLDTQKEYIDIIIKSGEHLLNLIDDIIDIARIESGEISINPTACNVVSVISEAMSMLSARMNIENRNDVQIIINNQLGKVDKTLTDPLRLKQIIVNLMSNALKFTTQGTIEFGVFLAEINKLQFYVKDTGIGIEPENLELIFENFKQANDTIRTAYGGAGLGLAITKNLVNLLGGQIWVESELGKGSKFSFTIPLITTPLEEIVDLPKTNPDKYDSKFLPFSYTILIAEDEDSNFIFLNEILKKYNIKVIRAKDGVEAIDFCNEYDFDIVFMDIQMPRMDGLEAIKHIKSKKPNLLVVAQTAYALEGEREKCLGLGCNDYVSKPIRVKEIERILNTYLFNKKVFLKN